MSIRGFLAASLVGLIALPASAAARPVSSPCPLNVTPRDPGWVSIGGPDFTSAIFNDVGSEDPEPFGIETFAVDPGNPQRIYVGGGTMLFRSLNGGCSWTKVFPTLPGAIQLPNSYWHVTDVDIAPSATGPRVYLQVSMEAASLTQQFSASILFYSDDDGETWSPLDIPKQAQLSAGQGWLTVAPSDTNTLYLTRGNQVAWTLFVSHDRGVTWDERPLPGVQPEIVMSSGISYASPAFVVNPANASDLWAVAKMISGQQVGGHFKELLIHSTDAGETWSTIDNPASQRSNAYLLSLAVYQAPGEIPRVAIADFSNLWISVDGGNGWTEAAAAEGDESIQRAAFGRDGQFVFAIGRDRVLRYDIRRAISQPVKIRVFTNAVAEKDNLHTLPPNYVEGAGLFAPAYCHNNRAVIRFCADIYRFSGRGT